MSAHVKRNLSGRKLLAMSRKRRHFLCQRQQIATRKNPGFAAGARAKVCRCRAQMCDCKQRPAGVTLRGPRTGRLGGGPPPAAGRAWKASRHAATTRKTSRVSCTLLQFLAIVLSQAAPLVALISRPTTAAPALQPRRRGGRSRVGAVVPAVMVIDWDCWFRAAVGGHRGSGPGPRPSSRELLRFRACSRYSHLAMPAQCRSHHLPGARRTCAPTLTRDSADGPRGSCRALRLAAENHERARRRAVRY
jgi:hypothetical protein